MTGKIAGSGNLLSLNNYSTVVPDFGFYLIFGSCSSLTTPPEIPAETIGVQSFHDAFANCTSLKYAPDLPAKNIAEKCYWGMFYTCTSLVTAPSILPALTLFLQCYDGMFNGCINLINAPELPAETLANNCYYEMFQNCSSLVNAPELPAKNIAEKCYSGMFKNCSNLVNAHELPATTLARYCYQYMFSGCSSLVNAPELPATNSVNYYCYQYMFSNCKKINYIKVAFKTWDSSATMSWLGGISRTGTFDAPRELPIEFGESRIPKGWQLPNHQYIIYPASDTFYFNSKLGIEANTKIDILFLQPENLQPKFRVTNGSLPDGLTLDENTGIISGSCDTEVTTTIEITISADGCEDKTVNLNIFITDALETISNLTSNDSNPDYEVSQSSDYSSDRVAWKAMDNDKSSNSRTKFDYTNDGWWQIKFTGGPVVLKKIEGKILVNSNPRTVTLRGSNDGEIFEDISTFSTNDNVNIIINQDMPYQYYRIYNAKSDYYLSISDIKFYYVYTEDYLSAKDQKFNWPLNEYKEKQIECVNFGGGLYFEILEGNLPEGITFDDAAGTFSGSSDVEFNENLVIQIDNGVNFITINVGLTCVEDIDPTGLFLYHPLNEKLTVLPTGQSVQETGTMEYTTYNRITNGIFLAK